jgi:serine/threonine protein kinase
MEYIDGSTLEDGIKNGGGKIAADDVVEVAIQILDTLEYLHGLTPPVIYRDLKPSNVMITVEGRAKLIDFGIARHFAPLSNATMIGTQGYARRSNTAARWKPVQTCTRSAQPCITRSQDAIPQASHRSAFRP